MKFKHDSWNTQCVPERIRNFSLTETVGYLPANQLIKNLMASGQRLDQFKKSFYGNTYNDSLDLNVYSDKLEILEEYKALEFARVHKQMSSNVENLASQALQNEKNDVQSSEKSEINETTEV